MKAKHLLLISFVTIALFGSCQKDITVDSGTTDKNRSYIQYMGQQFPLTDGEFSYGDLCLYDENDAHDYEINIELNSRPATLAAGSYSAHSTDDDLQIASASIELTENLGSADSSATDSAQVWLGKHTLNNADMQVSSSNDVYTISISGTTDDGQEVRANYVGRLYLDGKKKKSR